MTPAEKSFIISHKSQLISNTYLKSERLLTLLLQEGLTNEEYQTIKSEKTNQEKCFKLYDIMQTKDNGFSLLLKALSQTKQTGASSILKKYISSHNADLIETQTGQMSVNIASTEFTVNDKYISRHELILQLLEICKELGKDSVVDYIQRKGLSPKYFTNSEARKLDDLSDIDTTPVLLKCDLPVSCFQSDGFKVVSGHTCSTVKVWDISTSRCKKTLLSGGSNKISDVQFNNNIIISACSKQVLVWDINTYEILHQLPNKLDRFQSLKLANTNVIALGQSRRVYALELQKCNDLSMKLKLFSALKVHKMHAGDEFIITSSSDKIVRVWHFETLKLVRLLVGHFHDVTYIWYRNRFVASVDDESIRFWNVDTGNCFKVLIANMKTLSCLDFDDIRLVSGHNDGRIKIWAMHDVFKPDSSTVTQFQTIHIGGGNDAIIDISIHNDTLVIAFDDMIKCIKFKFKPHL